MVIGLVLMSLPPSFQSPLSQRSPSPLSADPPASLPAIRPLPPSVYNRIAAEEVVKTPANAVKELLENALDACSTTVTIELGQGGYGLIRVVDNGHGFQTEDLPLACQRFATSKLTRYEDLADGRINTFGFRGEALASISYAATEVTLTTRTAGQPCGYQAYYRAGKMIGPGEPPCPRALAALPGTAVQVTGLFADHQLRRTYATSRASNSLRQILLVATAYACDRPEVAFRMAKLVGRHAHNLLVTRPARSRLERVAQLGPEGLAQHLAGLSVPEIRPNPLAPTLRGGELVVSNPSYGASSAHFTLFVNGRLVQVPALRQALLAAYDPYLPRQLFPISLDRSGSIRRRSM